MPIQWFNGITKHDQPRLGSLASGGGVERNLYSQAIENKPINWTILAFVYSFFLYIPQDLIRATVRRREPGT
ncbi:hypothetical protein HBI71_054400 [Parastagonospora nodorum]|nr:hypothetical protein HBI71_054400 [Parastagonospora nodorum]